LSVLSSAWLTDKVYNDKTLLGTWGAFDKLPEYGSALSQGLSQNLGAGGQGVAQGGTTEKLPDPEQPIENKGESHVVALFGTNGHSEENGGSGGARTRHNSNVYGPETGLPSQIASQKPVALGPDLSQVVAAWADLPAALKAAILAIVRSGTGKEGQ
jgi:hypothetical protein